MIILVGILLLAFTHALYADESASFKLHPNILAKKNSSCKNIEVCGELVKMDCNSALDGPLYYFNNTRGKLLMVCGGACMRPNPDEPLSCKECPMRVWHQCKTKVKIK